MMRRERGRVIGRRRTEVGPEAEDARPHRNSEDRDRRQVSLQAAGRADATQGAHEEAHVEPADVDAQPFQDIRVAGPLRFGARRGTRSSSSGEIETQTPLAMTAPKSNLRLRENARTPRAHPSRQRRERLQSIR